MHKWKILKDIYFAMHDYMIIFSENNHCPRFQNLQTQILSHASKKLDFLITLIMNIIYHAEQTDH